MLKFDARHDDKLGADCIEHNDYEPDTQNRQLDKIRDLSKDTRFWAFRPRIA